MIPKLVYPQPHSAAGKVGIEVHCFVLFLNCCCDLESFLHVLVVGTVLEFIAFCKYYLKMLAQGMHHLKHQSISLFQSMSDVNET